MAVLALLASSVYLGVPAAPKAQASHGATEKLYVGQQGFESIAVFNADTISATSTPLSSISLGTGSMPQELVADDTRPYLYVSDSGLKLIHVINTDFDSLEYSVPLADTPQGLALSADGHRLYVATDNNIVMVDTRNRVVAATSPTLAPGFIPWDLSLNKDEDRLWVTGSATGQVRAFNTDTLVQIDSITPAGAGSGMGIIGDAADNNRAHYADLFSGVVRTFDDATNASSTWSSTTGFTQGPWAIEYEPRSPNRYLVTDGNAGLGDQVIEFSATAPFSETRSLSNLGGDANSDEPQEIAFSTKVDRAFVTLNDPDKVSVINLNPSGALTEAAVVPLGTGADPYGIEVTKSPQPIARFSGANRYDTGVLVSNEAFADGSVDAFVVASLEVFPDSLVAAPLAGLVRGPLLGTRKDTLPTETKDEIARVFDDVDDAEDDVYVIGGSAVVAQSVIDEIKAINSKLDVKVVAGANRYETAHFVAETMDAVRGTPSTGVFLAKGTDYPDALTAGAIASNTSFNQFFMPILLSESDALNEHAEMYLSSVDPLGTIFLAGGTAALSAQVATQASAYAGTTTRLGGTNRNDTARIIAAYFFPAGPSTVVYALNSNFPDALVAAPFAGITSLSGINPVISAPILLVGKSSVPSETSSYLGSISSVRRGFISGGPAAVEPAVEASLNGLY